MQRWKMWTGTRTSVRVVLSAVLALCAYVQVRDIRALRAEVTSERRLGERNDDLIVTSIARVDTAGGVVFEALPSETRRVAAIYLRRSSVARDVALWNEVSALLGPGGVSRIIAHCEDSVCAELCRRGNPLPNFTVLTHGQAATVQAVANADLRGAFVVLSGTGTELRRVQWRSPTLTAAGIVAEVLK